MIVGVFILYVITMVFLSILGTLGIFAIVSEWNGDRDIACAGFLILGLMILCMIFMTDEIFGWGFTEMCKTWWNSEING